MKVTLITVTRNSEKYLADCIESVRMQDYANIEYIVIDGSSTDNTLSIIRDHASVVDKWLSEKDGGMYDAINKGLKLATGDIIGILNSDDFLASKTVISKIVQCFQENGIDSLYGDLVYVDEEKTSKVYRYWKGSTYNRRAFEWGWMPAHPTFYVRRSVVEQLGGYETHYFSAADFEWMTRYLYRHRVSSFYLPELIVKMRKGGMSNAGWKRRLRANRRDYLALKRNGVPFPLLASLIKPIRKLPQFVGFLNAEKEAKAKLESFYPAYE
ncbi:glycosyltransferase family 2 protein [Flavisolibacter nicotianae]|uniref:glycosyltransferase family 2 protein n=1 Tax=Flavisolibacter nicotianae TaxID=2364882 RepID=UPI000EAC9DB0|nr:glycosyltransferase family 2 protein [Flavisolibacter nicotianae]